MGITIVLGSLGRSNIARDANSVRMTGRRCGLEIAVSLKKTVKTYFAKPPAFFEWPEDDTQAVSQGAAVLQCKTDNTATLACMMPPNNETIVRYNTNLLVLLVLCADWKQGNTWLALCFRVSRRMSGRYKAKHGRMRFDLTIDKANSLTTLHVEELT